MSRVALIGENSVEYINQLLEIWNSGDCAVLLDWRIPFQTAVQMMREADVSYCIIEERLYHKSCIYVKGNIQFTTYVVNDNGARLLPDEIRQKYRENMSHNEAVVIYSSGTTGKAKGAILSHYAITTNADAIIDYMELGEADCIYMVKTISHLSSITGELLVSLRSQSKLLVAPVIVPPRIILKNAERYHVTRLCINPAILRLILDEITEKSYDISSLRELYIHGAKTDNKLGERARLLFKDCTIYFEYGLTEAGPRVTSQKVNRSRNASVGKAILGVSVVATDNCGAVVEPNVIGIIHVKTQSVYSGYIQGEKELPSLYEDWLNTGDVGYFNDEGELFIVGRVDDVIIIDAHKIYPSEIEKKILEVSDVSECVITKATLGGKNVIACLYAGKPINELEIRKALTKMLLPYEIPRIFVWSEKIPRTLRGKISVNDVQQIISENLKKRGNYET